LWFILTGLRCCCWFAQQSAAARRAAHCPCPLLHTVLPGCAACVWPLGISRASALQQQLQQQQQSSGHLPCCCCLSVGQQGAAVSELPVLISFQQHPVGCSSLSVLGGPAVGVVLPHADSVLHTPQARWQQQWSRRLLLVCCFHVWLGSSGAAAWLHTVHYTPLYSCRVLLLGWCVPQFSVCWCLLGGRLLVGGVVVCSNSGLVCEHTCSVVVACGSGGGGGGKCCVMSL
jgi:hypothetical protein